jgi:uncharacterized membrane protein YphA (DoxX/SURF4 family)
MFYRVDYMLAVQIAGIFLGFVFSKRTATIRPDRLASGYYVATSVVLLLRVGSILAGMFLGAHVLNLLGAAIGDIAGVLFGTLFGLVARRNDRREFLGHPSVLAALCFAVAFTFALAAIGKVFALENMTDFFTQSGYSVTFLKFVVSAEILGALGMLLPWAVWLALIGLSVDMFGAVITHVHNRDSLNDSTGAIALLIHLMVVGVLWTLRPRTGKRERTVKSAIAATGIAMVACLLVAVAGSVAMRHGAAPAASHAFSFSR